MSRLTIMAAQLGGSMTPALRASDLLEIEPRGERPLEVGDPLLFIAPGSDRPIAHRVSEVTPGGIRTRGDRTTREDPWLLDPARVIGRVRAVWRDGLRLEVAAGERGRRAVRAGRCEQALHRALAAPLRPLYRLACRSGIVRLACPARMRPRPVRFRSPDGERLRLLLGARVVGRYDAAAGSWRIRAPYRLLVDERARGVVSGVASGVGVRRDWRGVVRSSG